MNQRGFTLLIAVLIGGLMLAIGFSIFNISYKELILASSARESHIAFYAADTGLECALWWDQQTSGAFDVDDPIASVTCVGQTVAVSSESSGNLRFRNFTLPLDEGRSCVQVSVEKRDSLDPYTRIEARGTNTACGASGPRTTERGLRAEYEGI